MNINVLACYALNFNLSLGKIDEINYRSRFSSQMIQNSLCRVATFSFTQIRNHFSCVNASRLKVMQKTRTDTATQHPAVRQTRLTKMKGYLLSVLILRLLKFSKGCLDSGITKNSSGFASRTSIPSSSTSIFMTSSTRPLITRSAFLSCLVR